LKVQNGKEGSDNSDSDSDVCFSFFDSILVMCKLIEGVQDELTFEFETTEGLEPDHKLLLRSILPLLQSRNSGVVMSVATLYHYCSPRIDQQKIAKALLRTMRTRREVQYVVLNGITNISSSNPVRRLHFLISLHSIPPDSSCLKKKEEADIN